jgi:hypothetical protein
MARTKFSELRDTVVAEPGAPERLAGLRAETLEEIRLHELRHGEAISQAELAGRSPRERSQSSNTPTTCVCRRCASTSMRSAHASSSSPCSTTTTVACRSISDGMTQPEAAV